MTGKAKDALPLDVYVPLCTIPPQGVSDFTLIGHAGSREPTNAISKSRLTFFYVQMYPHVFPNGAGFVKEKLRQPCIEGASCAAKIQGRPLGTAVSKQRYN